MMRRSRMAPAMEKEVAYREQVAQVQGEMQRLGNQTLENMRSVTNATLPRTPATVARKPRRVLPLRGLPPPVSLSDCPPKPILPEWMPNEKNSDYPVDRRRRSAAVLSVAQQQKPTPWSRNATDLVAGDGRGQTLIRAHAAHPACRCGCAGALGDRWCPAV